MNGDALGDFAAREIWRVCLICVTIGLLLGMGAMALVAWRHARFPRAPEPEPPSWVGAAEAPEAPEMNGHEHHLLSDYSHAVRTPSALLSGASTVSYVFRCPRCWNEQPIPVHGKPGACTVCGLGWLVYGNSLELWDGEAKP